MKKNYLLIALFLLLGGATAIYLFSKNDEADKNTLGWDRKFAVENEADIHKIFIGHRTGTTVTLKRNGDHWTYNDQWRANPTAVRDLLKAITNMTLKFVPPRSSTDNIVKKMASKGLKVEIYDQNDQLLKAYYIGGIAPDGESTLAIMDGSEQPMAVEIPQMVGHLRPRFDMIGDQWRDKAIFSYTPEEIEAVSVEYPKQRNKSFRLQRDGSGFQVTPFYENVQPLDRTVNNGRAEGYLVGFERLVAENFLNDYQHKDSIRATIPFSIVTVTDKDGNEKAAAFYQSYKINTATGDRSSDVVERYYADVNTGDWMLAQQRVFGPIFWPYEQFFDDSTQAIKD